MKQMLGTLALLLIAHSADAADVICTTGVNAGSVVDGDLIVPAGASCGFLEKVLVTGNVYIGPGAILSGDALEVLGEVSVAGGLELSANNKFHRNIDGDGCQVIQFSGTVSGNVSVSGCVAPNGGDTVVISDSDIDGSLVCRDGTAGCRVSGVTIGGNVRIDRNVPPSSGLSDSTIAGNVIVTQNSGKYVLVGDNTIAGNLICIGNEPPPSDEGHLNTVEGNRVGQCAGQNF